MTTSTDTKPSDTVLYNRSIAERTLSNFAVVQILNSLDTFTRNRVKAHVRSGILSLEEVLKKEFQ